MLQMTCPHCNATLQIPVQYAGQRGTCKHCGKPITAPGEPPPPPPPSKVGQLLKSPVQSDPYVAPDNLASLEIDPDAFKPKPSAYQEEKPKAARNTTQLGFRIMACGCLMPFLGFAILVFLAVISPAKPAPQRPAAQAPSSPAAPSDNSDIDWGNGVMDINADYGFTLHRGGIYLISRQTPLMPHPGARNLNLDQTIDSIAQAQQLPPGSMFQVVDWSDEGSTRWYHVNVMDTLGQPVRGYINRTALVGQNLKPAQTAQPAQQPSFQAPAPTATQAIPRNLTPSTQPSQRMVYIVPNSTVYHVNPNCRTLNQSRPSQLPLNQVSGRRLCKVCS